MRQPDGQVFMLELVSDITERERLYARLSEAERLAATGELAAGVAHEIRNPLAAIVNATTLLSEEESLTREERATTLGAIRKEARRLNQILSDFLVFARPREPKRLVGDIREVVDHVAALIREDPSRAQRAEVEVRVDAAVPSFAFDADQMTQVVWNIALNGIEALESGPHWHRGGRPRAVGGHRRQRYGPRNGARGTPPYLRSLLLAQAVGHRARP